MIDLKPIFTDLATDQRARYLGSSPRDSRAVFDLIVSRFSDSINHLIARIERARKANRVFSAAACDRFNAARQLNREEGQP
jgi:hypothetical protein